MEKEREREREREREKERERRQGFVVKKIDLNVTSRGNNNKYRRGININSIHNYCYSNLRQMKIGEKKQNQ